MNLCNVKKIIISGDLLRFKNSQELLPFNYERIYRYYELLKYQLQVASGLPVEIWNTKKNEIDAIPYEILGYKKDSPKDWVKIYDVQNIPQKLVDYYADKIKDSLVIYNEPTKTLKKIHDILDVPYIDIMPHPIRFLDDHLFAVSTNSKEIQEYFKMSQLDDSSFYLMAQLFKSQIIAPIIDDIKPNSLLIVGQTEIDKSLILGDKLFSLNDFADEILKLSQNYSQIYFVPHPYVKDKSIYDVLLKHPSCKLINYPSYRLLSCANIAAVAGISSSVLYEAKYFSKKAFFLKKSYSIFDEQDKKLEYFFTLDKTQILQPSFWGKLFNKEIPLIRFPVYPNQIRAALNDYWSYTEYDPVVRTVKRSIYGDAISSLIKKSSKIKPQKTLQITPQITNNLHWFIKLLKFSLVFSSFSELCTFIALSNKLKKFESYSNNKKRILHCITYRPFAPNGGRGGAGAVQSAMQKILGDKLLDYDIKYTFSERDGIWHTSKNKFYTLKRFPKIWDVTTDLMQLWANMVFVFDKVKNENALYITHEIFTAYALALMKKKYILVLHCQGTKLQEIDALGEKYSYVSRRIISYCEKFALKNAYKVYFPSNGAYTSYISSTYSCLKKLPMREPLYNTLYAFPDPVNSSNIAKDESVFTFLSIGTMTKAKGQDQTLNYLINLVNSQKIKIRWICIGRGPLANSIKRGAKSFSQNNELFQFIYLEKESYPSIRYLLSISDIYIMLHRVSIFDLATLEAMNSRLMVILSRTGGNQEFNVNHNILFSDEKFIFNRENVEKNKDLNKNAYITKFNSDSFKQRYSAVIDSFFKDNNVFGIDN